MSDNLDSIMRRIAKLLAIANDDRANPNEAAAAAGMAERIMRKYQLENSDIIIKGIKTGEDMDTADCLCTAKTNGTKVKTVPLWASWMATRVAELNSCAVIVTRDQNSNWEAVVRFMGYKGDVQVAKYMLDYLVGTTLRLCNEYKKTPQYEVGGRSTLASYRSGVAIGICSSLQKLKQDKEAQEQTSTGTSLIVVKQEAIIEKFGEAGFTRKVAKTITTRGSAYRNGVQDGKQVDVDRRGLESGLSFRRKQMSWHDHRGHVPPQPEPITPGENHG